MSRFVATNGVVFELGLLPDNTMQVLRWLRDGEPVTLREVIGALERYEPMRSMTAEAVGRYLDDETVSCTIVRAELQRVLAAEIVLNRGLREAVLASPYSMSMIAMRCGRFKRTSTGKSGETSWLARRIGVMPEGGLSDTTPWVHTDVLALVAWKGLGVEPRTVEVDVAQDVEIEEHWCSSCRERVTTAPDRVCPWCETQCGPLLGRFPCVEFSAAPARSAA